MRRLIRPAMFTGISVGAIAGFIAAGRLSPQRLSPNKIGGWLDEADPVDALAEIARWVGLGLASYVAAVSFVALLAEVAAAVRMPRVHHWLHRLIGVIALPALRRRLLELTAVATITAASMHALPAGATAPPAPIALIAQSNELTPLIAVRGEFQGFGITTAAPAEADAAGAHTVRKGETLSQIIRAHYGRFDNQLLHDVVVANPQITDPNLILVGWTIVLPDVPSTVVPAPVTPVVRGEASWAVVTVQRGDTLWDIVDRHYGHATADLVWATVDANPGLTDPNLIFAGQLITLPPNADQPPAVVPTVIEPTIPSSPATETPTVTPEAPTPVVEPPVDTPDSVVVDTPTVPTPPPTSETPSVAQPSGSVQAAPSTATSIAPTEAIEASADEEVGPSVAQLIGWTGGAGLAAAVLGLATRRRRRLPLADRVQRPSNRAVELGVALRETDNLGTVDWAARALQSVASSLRPRPGEPTSVPRLLRLASDQIELVWDTPCTDPPQPWRSPDGGWSWTLDRSIELTAPDSPNPCPCLVTIGRRSGIDVLLNLESCGALTISGEPDGVDGLVRSIATELACSTFADAPTVLIVGGGRVPGEPEHARLCEASEAIGWLRDRSDAASALLAHRRLTSLFALRARSRPQDGHEPVIVIVDPAEVSTEDVDALVGLANGDLGAVVVVIGIHEAIEWQLDCAVDAVTIAPLGLVLDPTGFDSQLVSVVDEIVPEADPETEDLEDADESDAPQLEQILTDHFTFTQLSAGDADEAAAVVCDREDEWDVELKVLGQVRSAGTKQPLTPTELHLAIYLAFHRNGENSDTIATMVWPNGAADRTITNTMASLRRKLGTGSDGEMLFPLGRDNQYIYRLSRRVVTDWDRFVELTKRANDVPPDGAVALLDEALDLVDGPPFRAASGYSWAYSDGTATLMTETVRAAARRCAEMHLARGEPLEACRAASIGARATDADGGADLLALDLDGTLRLGERRSAK